jgi:hypothetical protein
MSSDGSYRDILYGGDPHGSDRDGDDEPASLARSSAAPERCASCLL